MYGKRLEVRLRLKSFDKLSLFIVKNRLSLFATSFSLKFSSINLPKYKKRLTILKSPHVNKKARDQVEECAFNCLVVLRGVSTPNILRDLCGVDMRGVLVKLTIL